MLNQKNNYLTVAQVAKILKISRVAVYKRVKRGQLEAIRIGKYYAIPKEGVLKKIRRIKKHILSPEEKMNIKEAVEKTFDEYGEVLKKLGDE